MANKTEPAAAAHQSAALSFFDQYGLISKSEYFDADFYLARYADVADSGLDPVSHYLERGAGEGRDPHPEFDAAYYLAQCLRRGIRTDNPLLHYILSGQHLGLQTRRSAGVAPAKDQRQRRGADQVAGSGLFDRHFYNLTYRLDLASDIEAIEHFLRAGAEFGYKPNLYFDPGWYLKKYPEVREGKEQPLLHYLAHGDAQGRQPSPLFDTAWYRKKYKLARGANALAHFLARRRTGKFSPLPDFDLAYYFRTHPDLPDAGIDPFEHFVMVGVRDRKDPSAQVSAKTFVERYLGGTASLHAPYASLLGNVDKVEVGDGFAVVTGWVAERRDRGSAKGPLTISLAGREFGPLQLEFSQNLADAGIAAGHAAFAVAVPAQSLSAGRVVDVLVADADRQLLRVFCPGANVVAFQPSGVIDEVGPEGIRGWVFDPRLVVRGQKPLLRYDDEYDELIDLKGLRTDIPVQNLVPSVSGDQRKLYGFRRDVSQVLSRLGAHAQSRTSPITIKLVSSGVVLWTHTVPLRGGQASGTAEAAPAVAPAAHARVAAPAAVPAPAPVPVRPQAAIASVVSQGAGRKPRMLVVSWDMGHNPIGRAYLLADMARAHFDVKLIGPQFKEYGNALWEPLRGQTTLPIEIFPGGPLPEYLATIVKVVENNHADVVYVSKPRLPSLLFGYLMQLRHGSAVVVDSDDHELSFFKSDTPLSTMQAIAAAKADPAAARMPHAEVWTRLGEHLLRFAGAITVSNVALQEKFGGIMVRHARDENTFSVSPRRRAEIRREFGLKDDQIAVLFLGTPRPHKGIYKVAEALDRIHDPRLVFVIVGTITDARTRNQLAQYKRANIKYFDNQPWSRLHEIVAIADVSPVLQVQESRIAEFQIPAKLTDAIALGIPVLASRVAPLADFESSGAMIWIDSDADLEKALRARIASPRALGGVVQKGRDLYLKEFTYAANAARIKAAAEQARGREPPPELARAIGALFRFAGVPLPLPKKKPQPARAAVVPQKRKGPRDLVFFWKQNDTDLYGRRSDMMVKYLLESGKVRKILQFDRAINLHEMNTPVDRGKFASYHEGNLVYLNTTRRLLKMADTARVAKRTFLYRNGAHHQAFLGQDLPPREAYADFVKDALAECGMDPHPMAWVCPVVFDFPILHQQVGFGTIVVDIIDDQRRWQAQEAYLRRVEQNYVDVLRLGDLVLSNCEPVRDGFRDLRDDIVVVPNGAEPFAKDRQWPLPAELADLPRPIVGYVGNLRDRVDIGAIRDLAQKKPNWSVVLIGSAGGSLDVLSLAELPNVHLLGVKPYEQALAYIKHFDVAIMPHLNNAISENMNPLKLYVYFALGVPIVTTNVSNIGDISPYVSIAETSEQFIRAVEANLKGKGPRVPPHVRKAALEKVSWRSRVNEVTSRLRL